MGTVPILGIDLCPENNSQSLLHTFQSRDHSPNLNQWKNPAYFRNLCPSLNPNPIPVMEISHKYCNTELNIPRMQFPFPLQLAGVHDTLTSFLMLSPSTSPRSKQLRTKLASVAFTTSSPASTATN